MNKVIARLVEIFKLAADAQEDTILAKLDEYVSKTSASVKEVVTGLGLKEEGFTVDEIKGAILTAKGTMSLRTDILTALGLDANASNDAIKAAVITAKNGAGELPKLAARVQELEAKDFTRDFDGVLAKAFEEGKILPTSYNDQEWKKTQLALAKQGVDGFKDFWAKQPVVGPKQLLPTGGDVPRKGEGITEGDLAIAKSFGVSEADLKKYNPAVN